MITFLYILWILYTVGSLSTILLILSIGIVTKKQRDKQRKKFQEIIRNSKSTLSEESW